MSAFPPHRTITSIPVPPEKALIYLSTFLTNSKSQPHLLPNARLEPSGVTAGSSSSSVTIHNLQRVEAGLRGEWLAPTLDLEENNVPVTEGMDDGTNKPGVQGENGEGWMDLDEYQREQSIEGGEKGEKGAGLVVQDSDLEPERMRASFNEDTGFENGDEDDMPAPKKVKTKHGNSEKISKEPLDKDARRREKKLRLKAEKNKREKLRHKHTQK
jgi:hypothetical protein